MSSFKFSLLVFLCFATTLSGQIYCSEVSNLVVESSPEQSNNALGLSRNFEGHIAKDGLLYFSAYENVNQLSIWRTDGTNQGTIKLAQETNPFGSQWKEYFLTDDGVFLLDVDDAWYFIEIGQTDMINLTELVGFRYSFIEPAPDGSYYMVGYDNNSMHAIKYNLETRDIVDLGMVMESSSLFQMYSGSRSALFQAGSNPERLYLEDTNEVVLLSEYLRGINLEVDTITASNLYDKYLYVSFTDIMESHRDVIINIENGQLSDFFPLYGPIEHIEIEDDIFYLSVHHVVKFNKTESSAKLLYDMRRLSPSFEIHEDKLIIGGNLSNTGDIPLVAINLVNDEVRVITNAGKINSFNFHTDFRSVDGLLYYITEDSNKRYLNHYDFDAMESVQLDLLADSLGLIYSHALENVNGKLVSSKQVNATDHELFLCDGTTSSLNNYESQVVKVYPNPVSDRLIIDSSQYQSEGRVVVWNAQAKLILNKEILSNHAIDVTMLSSGLYFGMIDRDGTLLRFRFQKI